MMKASFGVLHSAPGRAKNNAEGLEGSREDLGRT